MNHRCFPAALAAIFAFIGLSFCAFAQPAANTLSTQEKSGGWRLLWDGKTTDGWRSAWSEDFPKNSWLITNGEFIIQSSGNGQSQSGGDIVTRETFSSFELVADFKIITNCNSGLKYFVHTEVGPANSTGQKAPIGYEYQILDDEHHPDAKLGRNGDRKLGALYDLMPASENKKANPIGEWNTARIVVRGNHAEHWLNGEKILEYDRTSPEFKEAFARSKFNNIPEFPTWPDGHILLQEHGSVTYFRNIKIRVLPDR